MKMRPGSQTGFLLCGKEWTDGEAMEVRSPWDQGLVGRVTLASRKDAREAVTHAVASVRRTRALPRWKRKEILEDIAAALIEQKERFAQLIVAEAGKPVRTARIEVERAILTFKTAAEEAVRLGGESIPLDMTEGNEGRWGIVQRFPIGPVLAITPFNFPLLLVAHKMAPAIAAGCPVVLKPAPQTPFTALALGEVILKAGWPEEALAILQLKNEDTAWLAEREDRLKLLTFTGSASVGWRSPARNAWRLNWAATRPLSCTPTGKTSTPWRCAPQSAPLDTPAKAASVCSGSMWSARSFRHFCGRWLTGQARWCGAIQRMRRLRLAP
jgi:acyl-CoA reductase-like NAD-dependent aldehyde dehydrogenase